MLPYSRACAEEDLVNSRNLQSILLKVVRRVYGLSLNVGQWRRKCQVDSISKPQLQIGFKIILKIMFKFELTQMTLSTRTRVISLIIPL